MTITKPPTLSLSGGHMFESGNIVLYYPICNAPKMEVLSYKMKKKKSKSTLFLNSWPSNPPTHKQFFTVFFFSVDIYGWLLRDHIKQTVVKQISVIYLNGGREWIIWGLLVMWPAVLGVDLLTHMTYGRFSNSSNCGRRFENHIPLL